MQSATARKTPCCPECRAPCVWKTAEYAPGKLWGCWVLTCECEAPSVGPTRADEIRSMLLAIGLPNRYQDLRRSDDWSQDLLVHAAVRMAGEPGRRRGLVMLGRVGTGKTTSGCWVMERWTRAGVGRCRYLHVPTAAARRDRNAVAETLAAADLVHIDDLGYQKPEASGWMFALVDGLYRASVATIYTTSRTRKQIRDSLSGYETSAAILDRLEECEMIEVARTESLRRTDREE